MDKSGQLIHAGEIRRFVAGGHATFTLLDGNGVRFTYKVKSAKKNRDANWSTGNQDKTMMFVSVLTGGNNESDFQYLGTLRLHPDGDYRYAHGAKSKINYGAASEQMFRMFWRYLEQGCRLMEGMEFWHEGSCCICGRKLTVPESVASGIGPECMAKGGF